MHELDSRLLEVVVLGALVSFLADLFLEAADHGLAHIEHSLES
jgi:hypothetical protein